MSFYLGGFNAPGTGRGGGQSTAVITGTPAVAFGGINATFGGISAFPAGYVNPAPASLSSDGKTITINQTGTYALEAGVAFNNGATVNTVSIQCKAGSYYTAAGGLVANLATQADTATTITTSTTLVLQAGDQLQLFISCTTNQNLIAGSGLTITKL